MKEAKEQLGQRVSRLRNDSAQLAGFVGQTGQELSDGCMCNDRRRVLPCVLPRPTVIHLILTVQAYPDFSVETPWSLP